MDVQERQFHGQSGPIGDRPAHDPSRPQIESHVALRETFASSTDAAPATTLPASSAILKQGKQPTEICPGSPSSDPRASPAVNQDESDVYSDSEFDLDSSPEVAKQAPNTESEVKDKG